MLFSKRHYEWLARWAGPTLDHAQTSFLADALAGDNPRFDRKRFMKAYVKASGATSLAYVRYIGPIWQPGFVCVGRQELSAYDVGNINGHAKVLGLSQRDAIAHWLSLNAGDFSHIDDFCARIGDQFYPWEREESEALYLNGQGEE